MLFAFLTTILFSLSAVFAHRSIKHLGSQRANFARLVVACLCLGLFAHTAGGGVSGPAFWWFFISGIIGFGIGDLALFHALPRIGSRLTVLLTQCLAAPVAAVIEWAWLGSRPSGIQALCGAMILIGVSIALAPSRSTPSQALRSATRSMFIAGLVAGILSSIGQGAGAAVSRKASSDSIAAGVPVDGVTQAYQRILGGILFTSFTLLPLGAVGRVRTPAVNPATLLDPTVKAASAPAADADSAATGPLGRTLARSWPWVVANALAGPVLGVACFQTALASTGSGIVLPIVALTPITVMPLSFLLERDRPNSRAILGAAIAVAAAIALTQTR